MITLFDPSLRNHSGLQSSNLGDVIIYRSVAKVLKQIFPNEELVRISTHDYLTELHYDQINNSRFRFVGGSNLLSSHIWRYNQWNIAPRESLYFLNPRIKETILFGCGWWQYQSKPDLITKYFYNKVFSKNIFHAVRDGYTKDKFNHLGLRCLNTSCPTLWEMNGKVIGRKNLNCKNVIITLTDYNKDSLLDNYLLDVIGTYFEKIYFFAQGIGDSEYLSLLQSTRKQKLEITVLSTLPEFENILDSGDCIYIGTRLHGGILALQKNVDAIIIAIDNRTVEIGRDVKIPFIIRSEIKLVKSWIEGSYPSSHINLDNSGIEQWLLQFK